MDRKLKTLLKGAGLERLVGGARRGMEDDPAEVAAWRASLTPEQLAEMEKDAEARRIRTEEANKQNAINRKKQKEEQNKQELLKREKQFEEDKKQGIEMLMPSEADYQEWFKANYPNTDPSIAGSLGDTNIYQNENHYAQQYLADLEEENADPVKMTKRAMNEIKAAKQKMEEFKTNPPKPSIKDFAAFGLPRTATFDQLVAAVSAARAKGELSQNQKNYGSSIVDHYLKIKETAEADPQQYSAKKAKEYFEIQKTRKAALGLSPDADTGDIAAARVKQAKQGKITQAKWDRAKQLTDEWRAVEASENRRIREALSAVSKEISAQMAGKDKIDQIPYRVMFEELLNNEISRKQIYHLQELAYKNGMETPEEYVNAVNAGQIFNDRTDEPVDKSTVVLFDAAKATDEYRQKLENEITWQDKAGHWSLKAALLLTDIAAELLPYAMPMLGTALSLGWKAFAPEGSLNYQEGTIGQKFGRLGLSIIEDGAMKMLGFGKTRTSRRKAIEKLMDDEKKLRGGYRLTEDGEALLAAWNERNLPLEGRVPIRQLLELVRILTVEGNVPIPAAREAARRLGTEWNDGLAAIEGLLDYDEHAIGFQPLPARRRGKQGKGRGQASGFVMRMMAENKKKHKGQYKNPSNNDYGSSMKSFRAFDYSKMENPSKFLKEHFSGEPVPFVSKRAEKKAEDTALASIRASKMSQAVAKTKMEEARKKIGEKPQYQILYNAFRRYVS